MGFNTTVIVFNDALASIAGDAQFGAKLVDAISGFTRLHPGPPLATRVNSGGSDAARVVETHHADTTTVVAVGGNHATVIGAAGRTDHHTPEGKLHILAWLAAELGYTLVETRKLAAVGTRALAKPRKPRRPPAAPVSPPVAARRKRLAQKARSKRPKAPKKPPKK